MKDIQSLLLFVLLGTRSTSLQQFNATFLPFAEGRAKQVVLPSSHYFTSSLARAYVNELHMCNLTGIVSWFTLLEKLKASLGKTFPVFLSTLTHESFLQAVRHFLGSVNLTLWQLPVLVPRHSYTGYPHAEIRWVGCWEWLRILNRTRLMDLFLGIYELVLFGIPVQPVTLQLLELEDVFPKYMTSRLFGGYLDSMYNFSSRFAHIHLPTAPQPEDAMLEESIQNLSLHLSEPDKRKRWIADIQSRVHQSHYLGSNSEYIQYLTERNIFSHPDSFYKTYLATPSKQPKLGYQKYVELMRNGQSVPDPVVPSVPRPMTYIPPIPSN